MTERNKERRETWEDIDRDIVHTVHTEKRTDIQWKIQTYRETTDIQKDVQTYRGTYKHTKKLQT